jgi:hypothetical protein
VVRRRFLPSSYAFPVRRFDAPRLAVPVVIVAPTVEAAGTAHLVDCWAVRPRSRCQGAAEAGFCTQACFPRIVSATWAK